MAGKFLPYKKLENRKTGSVDNKIKQYRIPNSRQEGEKIDY